MNMLDDTNTPDYPTNLVRHLPIHKAVQICLSNKFSSLAIILSAFTMAKILSPKIPDSTNSISGVA